MTLASDYGTESFDTAKSYSDLISFTSLKHSQVIQACNLQLLCLYQCTNYSIAEMKIIHPDFQNNDHMLKTDNILHNQLVTLSKTDRKLQNKKYDDKFLET